MQELLNNIHKAITNGLNAAANAMPADVKRDLRDCLVYLNNVVDQPTGDETDAALWRALMSNVRIRKIGGGDSFGEPLVAGHDAFGMMIWSLYNVKGNKLIDQSHDAQSEDAAAELKAFAEAIVAQQKAKDATD